MVGSLLSYFNIVDIAAAVVDVAFADAIAATVVVVDVVVAFVAFFLFVVVFWFE